MPYLIPVLSFLLCLAATPLVRFIALKKGWVAHPSGERWHKKPTALLGGIGIYLGLSIALLFVADFSSILPHFFRTSVSLSLPSLGAVIWLGMTFLFILGLLDDLLHIKPQTKLVGQILVASLVAFLGFRLHWFTSLTIDTMVTMAWIVGITNAFNLLDNMDGLCTGIAFIAAAFLTILYWSAMPKAVLISTALAGALAAFLVYNFNPASIFMGDSGSLIIGFALAVLSLYFSETETTNSLSNFAVPVMLMLVPIFDTTLVTFIRLLSGRKASVGGRDHTSHRLVLMGFSEKKAVFSLYGIAIVSGVAALFVSQSDTLTSPIVIIPVALSISLMGIYLAQLRIYPEKEFSLLRDRPYTPVLVELTYKRQILQVILDLGLIAFSYYLSYRLRFSADVFPYYFKVFLNSLPTVIACKLAAFFSMGIYRGLWGSMGSSDIFVFVKASTLATILSVAAVTFIYRCTDFSKGIFVIDWLLTNALLLGTRGSFRFFLDTIKRKALGGEKALIYGAGRGGELLLRELLNNEKLNTQPIGFIDDDVLKTGKRLQGFPILGAFKDLETLMKKYNIGSLLISFNRKDSTKLNNIKKFCQENNLVLKQFSISVSDIDLER
ncbi:Undecaprenyl-phosphate alpha-N-acetylglucosaminyl 1-phosphate transferase (EC [Olavius sp. associated proteobacterium Delta 1]|nr:Undecaprenyl-phosphate alpha-N-acetylglucosaminyl 1-phosphate transferase (EC [Olavius sp. associated proteobacterium Delta 1]